MQLSALLVVFSEVKVSAVPDCCITGHKNFVFFSLTLKLSLHGLGCSGLVGLSLWSMYVGGLLESILIKITCWHYSRGNENA